MCGSLTFDWNKWKGELEEVWRNIPKPFRSEHTVRGTLQSYLYCKLRDTGLCVIADYRPPRVQERPIDLIALDDDSKVVCAICIDSLITLQAVKSLDSLDASHKVIFTIGVLEKKVKESRFFLKQNIDHVHLKPF